MMKIEPKLQHSLRMIGLAAIILVALVVLFLILNPGNQNPVSTLPPKPLSMGENQVMGWVAYLSLSDCDCPPEVVCGPCAPSYLILSQEPITRNDFELSNQGFDDLKKTGELFIVIPQGMNPNLKAGSRISVTIRVNSNEPPATRSPYAVELVDFVLIK